MLNNQEPTDKEGTKARLDLINAGILVNGQLTVSNLEELKEALIDKILDSGYDNFWKAVNENEPCYEVFKCIIGEGLSESTIRWRLRRLTALAKKLEVIPNKRLKY